MTVVKTMRSPALALCLGLVALSLGACTTTVAAKPEYVSAGLAAPVVQGKAVLVMEPSLQSRSVSAHPDSLTGSATSLNVPIGGVIREVGRKVFANGFSGGADVAAESQPGAYDVVLRLDGFSYKYDQLSNLGFAITPKVTVALTSEATGPDGSLLFRKRYERADYATGAYLASLQPGEKINQSLHLALGEIFREMLDDVAKARAGSAGGAIERPAP